MRKLICRIFIYNICFLLGILFGGYWIGHKYCLKLIECRKIADKHLHSVRIYDIWMMIKQNGKSMEKYFIDKGIQNVAIYGMSYLGIRLFHELNNTSICVKYGIDCNPNIEIGGLNIFHLENLDQYNVDAVVVTAIFSFDVIKNNLENIGFTNIISLDELLYDLI